jgi:hypothetical protein
MRRPDMWLTTVIPATREAEMEDHSLRIAQAKIYQDPISTNKPCMVVLSVIPVSQET